MSKFSFRNVLLLSLFIPSLVFSEMNNSSTRSLVPELRERQYFDPQNTMTITGEVVDVVKVKHPDGTTFGVHLILKSDNENVSIHVGPEWFLEELGLKLDEGDNITVEGIVVEFQGVKAIIATSIQANGQTYTLRDSEGAPEWRGRGNFPR